jgi:hypothetical protein
VAGTLVGLVFITFGMFNLRIIDPGYLAKKDIKSRDNVLDKLSKEFETHKTDELTQLD